MSDVMSTVGGGLESGAAGEVSSTLKLEKAYLLIIPPSSPAGGALAATLGGIVAAEAGTAAQSSLQSSGDSSGANSLQSAESTVGGNAGNKVTFMFNPHKYTVSKQATWMRELDEGATSSAIPTWRGAGPRTMNIEIFLDATYSANGGIQADIDLLFACCNPTLLSVIMMKPSPPFVLFGWGVTIGFLSFVRSVRAEYKLFRPDGTPIRAECELELEEIPVSLARQNPTSGGSVRRMRTTVAGDTLQSIAHREYGRPTMWRALAEANGIEDPLRVAPGTTLLVPPVGEAATLA